MRVFGSYIQAFLLLVLLFFSFTPLSVGLDTGELQTGFDPMEITIPISINLWGFGNELQSYLESSLPERMIHEAYNPKTNQTNQFGIYVLNEPVSQINYLDIGYTLIEHDTYMNVTQVLENNAFPWTNLQDPTGGNATYDGYEIDEEDAIPQFKPFNEQSQYTIHLLNFSRINGELNQNSSHWYNQGRTKSIVSNSLDLRNILIIEDRGILFDPTAIAPYFNYEQVPTQSVELFTYISSGLIDIIEKVIVGSPSTNNYLALEDTIDFVNVVVGQSTGDIRYQEASRNLPYLLLKNELDNLFPYFSIRSRESHVEMLVSDIPDFENLLTSYTQEIDGIPSIVVDATFAEQLKNIIRTNYYSTFPKGYFYSTFIMLDSPDRQFVYDLEDGIVEYHVGEIGLGINKPYEWYDTGLPSSILEDPLVQMYEILGRMFGLPLLDSDFSSQITSPMSSYGVHQDWKRRYTQFEHDSLDRRYGLLYKAAVEIRIEDYENQLDKPQYFWYDTPRFDNASEKIEVGDELMQSFEFKDAVEQYIAAFKDAKYQGEHIEYLFASTENGFYMAIIVGTLLLYVKYMRDASISKEELLKKVEKLKNKQRIREDHSS